MNEFTKEELDKILNCVAFTCWEHPSEDEKLTLVRIKIQSLIELYDCKVIEVWHCEKCGHVQ
jgi:hypothetical protein